VRVFGWGDLRSPPGQAAYPLRLGDLRSPPGYARLPASARATSGRQPRKRLVRTTRRAQRRRSLHRNEVQHIVSTTRSKTSNKTTAVADFEASAAASRLAFEAASALRSQRADELAGAREALADVHAAWDTGDDTLSPDAEVQAQASISRATRLLAAAEVAERKAKAALLNTDVSLADALAPLIGDVLRIAPSVQAYRPTETASELPSAVAVQTAPTKVDPRSGALSGTVEVIFTRNELHREADAAAFEDAAADHDVKLMADAHTVQAGDIFTDVVRLRVTSLFPEVPAIIATADPITAATKLGNAVANLAAQQCKYKISGPLRPLDSGTRSTLSLDVAQPRVVSDRVHQGGSKPGEQDRRHLVVEVEVSGTPKTAEMRGNGVEPWPMRRATELLTRCVDAQQGQVVEGLGRVVSAAVVDTAPVGDDRFGRAAGIAVHARFEVISEAGDAASSPSASALPSQRRGRDPLEDLDGSSSHPGSRQ
jgi:hypothetical protein